MLIVPACSVESFSEVTGNEWTIVNEELIAPGFRELILDKLPVNLSWRAGWYLQQFIKLQSLFQEAKTGKQMLIWDADTIPFKPLDFFASDGTVSFFTGSERHSPYFEQMQRIWGEYATAPASFIAQCIPMKSKWINEIHFELIQKSTTKDCWLEPLLESIDWTQVSGFSEYEFLGTWVYNHHRNEMRWANQKWKRNGWPLSGRIICANAPRTDKLAFAAFETYQQPSYFKRCIGNILEAIGIYL